MKAVLSKKESYLAIGIILAIAVFARAIFIILAQADAGDTSTYKLFANNILRGCGMSHSDPSSNECILSSGGYFPGYPAFIAMVWFLFGKSVYAVLLAQLFFYIIAMYWLLMALMRLTNNLKVVFGIGIILALSPLQIGWFRFILTEPLSIATATWFFAELIISITQKKLRVLQLALALSASIYIRPDAVFMVLGGFIVASYIYDIRAAIKKSLILIVLTSIPVSGWMYRNVLIDHAPLNLMTEAAPKAPGYFHWLETWLVSEYERSDTNFPAWRAEYSKIKLNNSKFVSEHELVEVRQLLKELSTYDGQEFPKEIDRKFEELARKKVSSRGYLILFEIYAKRAYYLMLNPFSSWGLPLEVNNVDRGLVKEAISSFNLEKLINLLFNYKIVILGKILIFVYRGIMFPIFILLAIYVAFSSILKSRSDFRVEPGVLVLATAIVAFSRILFFVLIGGLESRYLIELVPWIECILLLWLCGKPMREVVHD